MNRYFIVAAIAGIIAAPAVALQGNPAETSDPAAAAIVADCSARKFETSVELEKDGQKRLTKLKLCAAQGSDQAQWVRTLEDAKVKIAAHSSISAESKAKIAVELDAEIARTRAAEAPPPKALPVVAAPVAKIPAPAQSQARPRLRIGCLASGETGQGSPCTSLQRTTQLTIRADQDVVGGARLRFLRRGKERGEIALAGMRQGQMIRSMLPPQLCVGVASSQVEIQVMRSAQVFETLGPYQLRC